MVNLTLTEKGSDAKQLTFEKDDVTIGRVQGNDIVLAKGNVSKRHCRIFAVDGGFSVEDLKSTNGTYINGRKIGETTVISSSDKIYVGDFIIKVENAPSNESVSSPPVGPEAGSLSTAIPRRPPPPPPTRAAARNAEYAERTDDEGMDAPAVPPPPKRTGSGRAAIPPPPPPPPRRPTRPTLSGDEAAAAPPAPADVDIDEEALTTRPPRLTVPPLKAVMSLTDEVDKEDVITASRDRGPLAPGINTTPDKSGAWLNQLLEADGISAILISGQTVEVERDGQRESAAGAPDAASLVEAVRGLAARGTPAPAADAGVVNVALPQGLRLTALFPPVADQLAVAIQKLTPARKSFAEMVADGAASKEMKQVLEACTANGRNVLVVGDHRANQTVVQALASSFPARFRVISLADGLGAPSGVLSWTKLSPDPRTADLVATAAALRPDYLIVEITSAPIAADVVHQSAMGHQEGLVASLVARSPADGLTRLQALAGSSLGGQSSLRELIASSFDVVVHASTLSGGTVRVFEVSEPKIDKVDGELRLVAEPLFTWKPEGGSGTSGKFNVTGTSSRLAATLATRGVQLPASVLKK